MIGLCIPDIGWLVCRFAVCRIFPALKSQAGKPRANEHPSFHQHFRQLAGMSPPGIRNGYASMKPGD